MLEKGPFNIIETNSSFSWKTIYVHPSNLTHIIYISIQDDNTLINMGNQTLNFSNFTIFDIACDDEFQCFMSNCLGPDPYLFFRFSFTNGTLTKQGSTNIGDQGRNSGCHKLHYHKKTRGFILFDWDSFFRINTTDLTVKEFPFEGFTISDNYFKEVQGEEYMMIYSDSKNRVHQVNMIDGFIMESYFTIGAFTENVEYFKLIDLDDIFNVTVAPYNQNSFAVLGWDQTLKAVFKLNFTEFPLAKLAGGKLINIPYSTMLVFWFRDGTVDNKLRLGTTVLNWEGSKLSMIFYSLTLNSTSYYPEDVFPEQFVPDCEYNLVLQKIEC